MTIANILQEIRDLCEGTSSSEFLDNTTLLRRVNAAYEELVVKIMKGDGLWQFDDNNYSDFPIGKTTLVATQNDYTFGSDVLEVEQMTVLKADGHWTDPLAPIDKSQMGTDPKEFFLQTGLPQYYDKNGSSLLVYPAPDAANCTLSNGLKVFFRRTASIYTSAEFTTGTKEPGFASPFHILVAYKTALPYCAKYVKDQVPFLAGKIAELEAEMSDFYGRRERDRKKVLRNRYSSHR